MEFSHILAIGNCFYRLVALLLLHAYCCVAVGVMCVSLSCGAIGWQAGLMYVAVEFPGHSHLSL